MSEEDNHYNYEETSQSYCESKGLTSWISLHPPDQHKAFRAFCSSGLHHTLQAAGLQVDQDIFLLS